MKRFVLLGTLFLAGCAQESGQVVPALSRELAVPDLDGDGVPELLVASNDSRSATGNYEWTLIIGPRNARRAVSTLWAREVRVDESGVVLTVSGHNAVCEEAMNWNGRELVPQRHRCQRYYKDGRLQHLPRFEEWRGGPASM